MTLSTHVSELKRKHQTLSKKVEEAQRAPSVDGLQIAELKKQKLKHECENYDVEYKSFDVDVGIDQSFARHMGKR